MRRFYITIAVPHMLYAADLFLTLQSGQATRSKGHIKRLGRVQQQATLHATLALRMTPTDSLDAHADLLPFQKLIEKPPSSHMNCNLTKIPPASGPCKQGCKKICQKPQIHELLHAHKIIPTEFKVIQLIQTSPKWSLRYKTHIPESRNVALEELGKLT